MKAPLFIANDALTSREALLLAAEKLFSIQGFNATSLRQIAAAGGHGNTNAVRYHFGAKTDLARAIFEYRVAQMEPIRAGMFDIAANAGTLHEPRTILEILFLPYLSLQDRDGSFPYAGFLVHYLLYQRPRGLQHVSDYGNASNLNRVLNCIAELSSFLPEVVAERRLLSITMIFATALVNQANRADGATIKNLPQLVSDLIDEAVSNLMMPWRGSVSQDFAQRITDLMPPMP